MLDAGYSILDAGYSMLDAGCSMLDTRFSIFDDRSGGSALNYGSGYNNSSLRRRMDEL